MRGGGTRSGSGGGGGGGGFDIKEGGEDEGIIARRMGVTVPELRAMRRYSETGDTTPFQRDTVVGGTTTEDPMLAGESGETSDAVSRKFAKRELEIAKTLPPGFEAFARAKLNVLGEIEAGMRMGKDNKGFQDGESERFKRDTAEAVRDGRMKPEQGGIVNAVIDGKPLYTVKGDTQINQYTGSSDTTEVGESKVRKNDRPPAGRAGGSTSRAAPEDRPATTADLDRQVKTAKDAIAEKLGVSSNEVNAKIGQLERRAASGDKDAASQLNSLAPLRDRLAGARDRLANYKAPKDSGSPAPAARAESPGAPPDITKIQGAPSGSTVGAFVPGRGWEVKDRSGKTLGYIGK